jgi:hypothetical protein
MSVPRQSITVSRSYNPASDQCVRALELLLKKPVSTEGGRATAPDDAMKGSKHDRARTIIPKPS